MLWLFVVVVGRVVVFVVVVVVGLSVVVGPHTLGAVELARCVSVTGCSLCFVRHPSRAMGMHFLVGSACLVDLIGGGYGPVVLCWRVCATPRRRLSR